MELRDRDSFKITVKLMLVLQCNKMPWRYLIGVRGDPEWIEQLSTHGFLFVLAIYLHKNSFYLHHNSVLSSLRCYI